MISTKFKAVADKELMVLMFEDDLGFKSHLLSMPNEVEVIVRPWRVQRSDRQNRYYHGVVLKLIADECGHTADEIHEVLKGSFLVEFITLKGKEVISFKSTANLSTAEFEEYLSQVRAWASTELKIYIPLPNEIDY